MTPDFVSQPVVLDSLPETVRRVDIEFHGVDVAVPSYEGRIFLGAPAADRNTEMTSVQGYLGSFSVFGKVSCWGEDEGHCHPASGRRFDRRHPPGRHSKVRVTVPVERFVEALARVEPDGAIISVVTVQSGDDRDDADSPLRMSRMSIIAYG